MTEPKPPYMNTRVTIAHDADLVSLLEQFTRGLRCSRLKKKRIRAAVPTDSRIGHWGPAFAKLDCKAQQLGEAERCRECRARMLAYRLIGVLEEEAAS